MSCGTERTVALLAFEDVRASPVADLMDIAQRQKTASELNAAILASQSQVRHHTCFKYSPKISMHAECVVSHIKC